MVEYYTHPEVRNLAPDLDEDDLARLGAAVVDDYQHDLESRQEWDRMHAEWVRMFFQTDKPINGPWPGSSEESLPILAEAATQFAARAHAAIFPSGKLLAGIPIGKPDPHARQRGHRIGTHMRWQLMHRMRGYKRNKKRLLRSVAIHGSYFTKAYYDPVKRMNRVDNCRAVDIIVPYGNGPRDVEDLPRWTHFIPMTPERSQSLERLGYFTDAIEGYEGGDMKLPQHEAHDDAMGQHESSYLQSGQGLVLEQFRYEDLDGDDYPEPYIVTVDANTKNVLRVQIGWSTDEAGNPVDSFGTVIESDHPEWKSPVNCLTHYVFMENPDGFYGLGQGHLLSQLNSASNKMLRQVVDSGTLSTVGNNSGFVSEQIAGVGGELEMHLGKFKKVPATADELSRGIFQFQFPGPSQVLPEVLQLLMMRADRLGSSTEAITGQTEKVMQPTTVMALIEQGLQVFSDVYEGILESWTDELGKLYRLNYKHMDPKEYFSALDIPGEEEEMWAAREDYKPDFQVKPIADPKQATKQQRLQRAQLEYQTLMQNPLVVNSPQHIYNVTRTFLEAIEADDIDSRLPNPASQIGRVDDPLMENKLALQDTPMVPMAFPDQDHMHHIQAHVQELDERRLGYLGRQLMMAHIEAHRRMNDSAGNQAMVGNAGNQMGAGANGGGLPVEGLGPEVLNGGSEGVVGTQTDPGVPADFDTEGLPV